MYMGMRTHVYTGIWTPDIAIRCLSQLLSAFKKLILNKLCMPGIVVHAFNAMHLGLMAEAGGCLSLRPTWPTQQVPGQPVVHRETLSQEQHNKQKTKCATFIVYICVWACQPMHVWRSDNDEVFSFYHMGPRNQTQVVMGASAFTPEPSYGQGKLSEPGACQFI